jgi:DNA-binding MarR family transcriptional regulator
MRETSVGTIDLLKRVELAVRSCMAVALAQFDLTPTQFLMLFRLRDRHAASAAELAREIGVRPQPIIEIIGPLERKRLLRRAASPEHRRVLHARVTAAGHKLLTDALRVAARIEAELLANVDHRETSTMQSALSKLWERAEKHELHPASIRARAEALTRAELAMSQPRRGRNAARRVNAS